MARENTALSLFSGAMGLDLGLETAGFRIAAAVECNAHAVQTIRVNRPKLAVLPRKLEDVTTRELLEAAGLAVGEAMIVAGGPSCQVFSTAGQRGSMGDPRSDMFRQFVRVVREAQPRFFVMENVRGLLSAAVKHRPLADRGPGAARLEPEEVLGSAFRVVANELSGLGYYVRFDLLNAADHGVPQTRQRLVFLGSRDGEALCIPPPTHDQHGTGGLPRWRTLKDALAGFVEDAPTFYRFSPAKEKYLRLVQAGGNWRDLPPHMQEEALGRAYKSWGGRSGFFRRLDWDKPSPALTTRPDSKATTLCHPTDLRPLSVGEYARIQQFPDGWRFQGLVREQYRQVGNAVPVGLGAAIGRAILDAAAGTAGEAPLGRVECANLDLLTKLSRRPTTIMNPPRMRSAASKPDVARWRADLAVLRTDVLDYAAPEVVDGLRRATAPRPRAGRAVRPDTGQLPLLAAE